MDIEVHCKRVQIPEDVRILAQRKTERLGRYLTGMERGAVYFADGHVGHFAEPVSCEVVLEGHGHVIRVSAVGGRPEAALERAVRKAELRLTRLKTKLVDRSRPRHAAARVKRPVALPVEPGLLTEDAPAAEAVGRDESPLGPEGAEGP